MNEKCECNWHHLQYCCLCEEDFADHHYTDHDIDYRQAQQDVSYFADLTAGGYSETGPLNDPTPLIESAQRVEIDMADYLQGLV